MEDNYRETIRTWNKVANAYQDKFMHLDLYNESYDAFLSMLPGNRVLDIGCGPGNITRYLLQQRPTLFMKGVDVSPNMLTLAAANNPSAVFEVLDARELYRLQGLYDGIICGFCLPYLSPDDCTRLFQECYRLLCQQGVLYLSFVKGDAEQSGFQTGSSGDRVYFYYHEEQTLIAEMKGFELMKRLNVGYEHQIHELIILRKISRDDL